MGLRDALIALLVVAVWGVNFTTGKAGLSEFPSIFMMSVRFALVAALLVPFFRLPYDKLRGVLALSVTLGTLHFSLMFVGLRYVDAGAAAIAAQLQVPFSALIAAFVFGDRLGWRRLSGLGLAFTGVVILAGEPRIGEHPAAILLVVGASLVWALSNIQIKKLGAIDGFALNGWMGLFAAPQLLLVSLLLENGQWEALQNATWRGWGSILYMVFGATITGYGLWYWLLRRHPVSTAVPWMLLVPVFGVLSGWAVLDEAMTWQKIAGGAVTIAGVAIITLRRPKLAEAKAA